MAMYKLIIELLWGEGGEEASAQNEEGEFSGLLQI